METIKIVELRASLPQPNKPMMPASVTQPIGGMDEELAPPDAAVLASDVELLGLAAGSVV